MNTLSNHYGWASRCRLEPVKKVAKMIKRRLGNVLTWFRHRISNGPLEGFNSRIQSIKSAVLVCDGKEIQTFKGNGKKELKIEHQETDITAGVHWYYWRIS